MIKDVPDLFLCLVIAALVLRIVYCIFSSFNPQEALSITNTEAESLGCGQKEYYEKQQRTDFNMCLRTE